jgi:hypothetical protein
VSGAGPDAGVTVNDAVGGAFSGKATLTGCFVVEVPPRSSATASVTTKFPVCVYVWLAVTPAAADPSPKSHEKLAIRPSMSIDADASTTTVNGATPEDGVRLNDADGGRLCTAPSSKHADNDIAIRRKESTRNVRHRPIRGGTCPIPMIPSRRLIFSQLCLPAESSHPGIVRQKRVRIIISLRTGTLL